MLLRTIAGILAMVGLVSACSPPPHSRAFTVRTSEVGRKGEEQFKIAGGHTVWIRRHFIPQAPAFACAAEGIVASLEGSELTIGFDRKCGPIMDELTLTVVVRPS